MSQPPLLQIEQLRRRYGSGAAAVDGVSFQLGKGELLALLGPSGCGKTTTLRLIAGFERTDQGRVCLNGQEITSWQPEQRGFGLVFQDYALFPHLSVAANVGFGLHRLPRPPKQCQRARNQRQVRSRAGPKPAVPTAGCLWSRARPFARAVARPSPPRRHLGRSTSACIAARSFERGPSFVRNADRACRTAPSPVLAGCSELSPLPRARDVWGS